MKSLPTSTSEANVCGYHGSYDCSGKVAVVFAIGLAACLASHKVGKSKPRHRCHVRDNYHSPHSQAGQQLHAGSNTSVAMTSSASCIRIACHLREVQEDVRQRVAAEGHNFLSLVRLAARSCCFNVLTSLRGIWAQEQSLNSGPVAV